MRQLKRIFADTRVQLISAVLVIFASTIISSLQGAFGFWLPIAMLLYCVAEIFLVYFVIVIPSIESLRPQSTTSDRIYTLERLKEFELTADISEIWVITSNLSLAFDDDQFGSTINTNIARGVKYSFYINNNSVSLAKERAKAMLDLYKGVEDAFTIYLIPDDLPFIDQYTDYDLFFLKKSSNIKGFIGSTINNTREYTVTTDDLALKLKLFIDNLKLNKWDASS